MNNPLLFRKVAAILLCATTMMACLGSDPGEKEALRYPGNGVPWLSKSQRIKALEEELFAYAAGFSTIERVEKEGIIVFHDLQGFSFVASKPLVGDEYCIEIGTHINQGNCSISIGNVTISLGPTGVALMQDGRMAYSNATTTIKTITIYSFGQDNEATKLATEREVLDIVKISIQNPAEISVRLDQGCAGSLGPFRWIRGLE